MSAMVGNVLIITGNSLTELNAFGRQFGQQFSVSSLHPYSRELYEYNVSYSFRAFVPIDEDIKLAQAEECLNKWSTPWDSFCVHGLLDKPEKTYVYYFSSFTNPPYKVINAMRRQHPNLTIHSLTGPDNYLNSIDEYVAYQISGDGHIENQELTTRLLDAHRHHMEQVNTIVKNHMLPFPRISVVNMPDRKRKDVTP